MVRFALCFSLVLLLTGCGEPIAPLPDTNNATASPDEKPTETPASEEKPSESPMPESSPDTSPEPSSTPKKGLIHQTTDVVVDAKEWLKKDGIEARDGKIEGVDPFSQAASGYFTLAAKASTLGLQQQVNNYKILNEKYPSYKEFMKMMQDNRIEFAKLRWYEIYGYNEDNGHILVLVDTVAKEEGP